MCERKHEPLSLVHTGDYSVDGALKVEWQLFDMVRTVSHSK